MARQPESAFEDEAVGEAPRVVPVGRPQLKYSRLANWIAALAALIIAIGIPAGYAFFRYERAGMAVFSQLQIRAHTIGHLIEEDPAGWRGNQRQLKRLLEAPGEDYPPAMHLIYDADGRLVAQHPDPAPALGWPTISRRVAFDGHPHAGGSVVAIYAAQDAAVTTAFLAVFSTLLGIALFWLLRVYPLRALTQAWEYLASYDSLTRLPNRVYFMQRMKIELMEAERLGQQVTVFALDLDHFKDVNETLGHVVGDQVLVLAAERMATCLPDGDLLARFGGDEFGIVHRETPRALTVPELAENLIEALNEPFEVAGTEVMIGVSIGMAVSDPARPETPDTLMKAADLALDKSKRTGRRTYHFYEEAMDAELQARKGLETELRRALREQQFEMHYQPQLDLATQRVTGVEALIRWKHPEHGMVPPGEFIPLAEEMGLIIPLSAWVLERACRDAADWGPVRVSVNLSPSQFQHSDVLEMVAEVLKTTGMPPERLELEVTEEVVMSDTEHTLEVLNGLRRLGVRLAMDDFGTGYSSLSYLRRFPFDKIKIDKSFIADLGTSEEADAIVRAVIGLGHALGMKVNAEGVETLAQADVLLAEGCDEVQGYLYGRPMPCQMTRDLLTYMRAIGTAGSENEQRPAAQNISA